MGKMLPSEQVIGIVVPDTLSEEAVEKLLAFISAWMEKMGWICFSCGDKAEVGSVWFGENENLRTVLMVIAPACEVCAKELEDGSESLYDLFVARSKRILAPE